MQGSAMHICLAIGNHIATRQPDVNLCMDCALCILVPGVHTYIWRAAKQVLWTSRVFEGEASSVDASSV